MVCGRRSPVHLAVLTGSQGARLKLTPYPVRASEQGEQVLADRIESYKEQNSNDQRAAADAAALFVFPAASWRRFIPSVFSL